MPSLRQRIFFFNRSIFAAWKANQSANAIAISGGADEEIHRIQEKQDAGTATPDELQVLSNLLSMKGQESAVYSQPGEKASAGGLVDAFNDLQGGGIFLNAGNAIATNSYLFYLTAIEENAHRYTSNEYIAKTAASNSMMYFNFVSWAAGYDTLSNNSYYGSTDRQKAWNALYNTATSDLLKKNTERASLVREADRAYGISVNDIQAEIFGNVLGSKLQGVSVYFEETGPVVVEGLGRFYLNSVISFDEYESAYNNALAGNYGKAAGFAALGIVLEVPGKVIKPFKYAGKAVKALFKGSKVVGEVVETAGTVNTGLKMADSTSDLFKISNTASSTKITGIPNINAWNMTTEFKGTKVYQRNDLFDPNFIDTKGRTNIQRMEKGIAPIGYDGNSVNLHHTIQTNDSPIAEILDSFHKENTSIIHINPNTIPSGIDRNAFNQWKTQYWKNRVLDFK